MGTAAPDRSAKGLLKPLIRVFLPLRGSPRPANAWRQRAALRVSWQAFLDRFFPASEMWWFIPLQLLLIASAIVEIIS